MTNKHMKICPIPLVIREVQIKTTIRYHFMSALMAKMEDCLYQVSASLRNKYNAQKKLAGNVK
jgi:hypothetical protein